MVRDEIIKEFEKNYSEVDNSNKKMMCVRRIIELEAKEDTIDYVERTELENLKMKIKKM